MTIHETIARQYHSTIKMLEKGIEACPEPLWLAASGVSPNRTWHIAFHALFYTHFYLAPTESEFVAWALHRSEYNFLGEVPWRPGEARVVDAAYTQAELLEYAQRCHDEVDARLPGLNLDAPSGFHWLAFDKLELQFYNIRHLAHHTGQIAERLRSQADLGVPWVR